MSETESARIKALQEFSQEYHGGRLAKKVSEFEFDDVVEFIENHDHLGHLEFEYAVNRWKLGENRSKHHSIMQEMLISANFRVHGRKR